MGCGISPVDRGLAWTMLILINVAPTPQGTDWTLGWLMGWVRRRSGGYQWRCSLRICISCEMVRTNNPTLEASNTFGWQPQVQHAAHTHTQKAKG